MKVIITNGSQEALVKARKGTVMLVLLAALLVGGIMASKLLPKQEVQAQRRSEQELRTTIAEIRQAFDLKEFVAGSFIPDLSTPAKINAVLKQLETENFLRNASMTDSTMFAGQWINNTFWVGTSNIPFNTSFEGSAPLDITKNEFLASWSLGTPDTIAASDTTFWPSRDSDKFDDYSGQNKFGKIMQINGASMKLTR